MTLHVAVVGAGAVGSAAARALARAGHRVTLLEQLAIDHDRGSSFGTSRIIRRTYADPLYTELMAAAYPLWGELAAEAGEPLLVRTGGLFFGPEGHPDMVAVRAALARHGVRHAVLDAGDVARRLPPFRLAARESAVWEPDAGLLRASACVRAAVASARGHGAAVVTGARVLGIAARRDGVRLSLDGATLDADRAVVACGPWLPEGLGRALGLPLVVTRQVYCHFEVRDGADRDAFSQQRFPVWIDFETYFYGFPEQPEAPGVKVALHRPGASCAPDTVDRAVREADRAPLRAYCARRLPDLAPAVALEKVCLYTSTPDEDFIVDRPLDDDRVVLVGGLSGHGFKFAPLLGQIAAWMATDKVVPWNLDRFRMARFATR